MPSLKEYKTKLNSLKNIGKITKTMKLVAASKLRSALTIQSNARAYAWELVQLISRLAASVDSAAHPLLENRPTVKSIQVLVLSSDKGLCGGFNNNLLRKIWTWSKEKQKTNLTVKMSFCGKRGWMFFRQKSKIEKFYENVTAKPDFLVATSIGEELSQQFLTHQVDEVYIAYNQFLNPLSQTPIIEKILPIDSNSLIKEGAALPSEYIFEPTQAELLKILIPRFLYFKIYYALLENSAGEHGARMTAMDKASQNAADLRQKYTLLRNRARQASITKELIEIVSGAEALK